MCALHVKAILELVSHQASIFLPTLKKSAFKLIFDFGKINPQTMLLPQLSKI
jgi:hypothetical protein